MTTMRIKLALIVGSSVSAALYFAASWGTGWTS